jgi:hypothetical protein
VPDRYVVFKAEDLPDELDEDVGPSSSFTAMSLRTTTSAAG